MTMTREQAEALTLEQRVGAYSLSRGISPGEGIRELAERGLKNLAEELLLDPKTEIPIYLWQSVQLVRADIERSKT